MKELFNIIDAMKGKNEKDEPKSSISVSDQVVDAANNLKPVKEYVFTTPHINFTVNGDYILVDIIFPLSGIAELRTAWNYLKGFGEKQNEQLDGAKTNILEFTIIPLEYNGKYFCSMINPIFWALQPSAPGAQTDSIRMLFEKEAVNFFEGEEVDEQEIEKELENEEFEKRRLEELEGRKEAEHEEYLNKMNERFNRFDN